MHQSSAHPGLGEFVSDDEKQAESQWLKVLVDCPGIQGLYTYKIPPELTISPGDILTVPFGSRIIAAIAIEFLNCPPVDIDETRIRPVESVTMTCFFPKHYWTLLHKTADYYCTPLMNVIRMALPPGLLGKSQRRIRLVPESIPPGAEQLCRIPAQQVLNLLRQQKDGDYSWQYLNRQLKSANQGIHDLIKRGWVKSYLEPAKTANPKQQKAVILLAKDLADKLTERQRHALRVLSSHQGTMWLTELLAAAKITNSVITTLKKKGYIAVQFQERLRLLQQPQVKEDQAKKLTTAQQAALKTINSLNDFTSVLLHGVTGSGKTEVYLQAIAPILNQNQSALVLVPEIGLTPQLTDRFRARFGDRVCVYHSALSDGERYDTWRQMLSGVPQVVIGTRSAIFAPLPKLGMIILDEEHDTSFKQTQPMPNYHARTVAEWRAQQENCVLLLGSATPSLETWLHHQVTSNSQKQRYLSLPERIQSRPMPPVEIVDMRQELSQGNRSIFSRSLQTALNHLQENHQQGILFINRRGHSTFVSCRSCGEVLECPDCDVSLSYHYAHQGAAKLLRCHYCNYCQPQPRYCPHCDSPYLKFFGSGTQKVTEELTQSFPGLRWLRFDSDTTRTKGAHRDLIAQFARGEADLLVGTQMLTKGLDLAQVTLVGVVAADGLLHHSDYRAAERAFQTLTQVAGRAGRGDEPGRVIIQTYNPENPVIQAVKEHNYPKFVQAELSQRQSLTYPPYGKLVLFRFSGMNPDLVQKTAESVAQICQKSFAQDWEILGPAPATVMRVAKRFRWQLLLKSQSEGMSKRPDFSHLFQHCPQSVGMTIDIDPMMIG